ncbi:MAG TPA: TetR/AcrR family transcriptional regulator [Flavisolibacter sp.]|nr:TetR/AcrR family transcriptional regulator [Flavisolibacter sp.]
MSQDQKQEAIIEAAIKRFAHFGVSKTTMTDIASDLSISKALLYYYFPDKLNLFVAVFKTITEANGKKDEQLVLQEKNPWKAIELFLEIRTDFIIRYHNILDYFKTFTVNNIPKDLAPVFTHLKKRELQRITTVMENGKKAGDLKMKDAKKAAELYYDFLESFRHSFFAQNPNFFPDKKQFQSILKKEKEFSVIFFNGLACDEG